MLSHGGLELGVSIQGWGSMALNLMCACRKMGFNGLEMGVCMCMQRWGSMALNWV